MRNGNLLKSHVSEICVKRININQKVGVQIIALLLCFYPQISKVFYERKILKFFFSQMCLWLFAYQPWHNVGKVWLKSHYKIICPLDWLFCPSCKKLWKVECVYDFSPTNFETMWGKSMYYILQLIYLVDRVDTNLIRKKMNDKKWMLA